MAINTMHQSMPLRTERSVGMIMLVAIMALWSLPTWVIAAPEPAGYVLMSSGEFHALQPNQVLRKLARKSPFYPGEVLRTGVDAKAQVRFRDGSLIALRAETQIKIDEFRYDEPAKGEDKNIFTLINGGFRTITGKIGKKNPENYQMKSSVASIGVRGTTYEVVIRDGLNVAAWQGTIVLKNNAGEMALGAGQAFNFAVVPGSGQMPQGMLTPPPVMTQDAGVGAASKIQDATVMAVAGAAPELLNSAPNPALLLPPTIMAPTDARLTSTEKTSLGRIGVMSFGNAVSGARQYRGLASNGTLAYPLLTRVDLGLNDPNFYSVAPTWVVRQGTATLLSTRAGIPTKYDVTWGTWDATLAAPVLLQSDKTDPNIITNQTTPVMWMMVLPTDKAVLASMTGGVSYSTMLANYGAGSGGAAQIDTHVLVDFDTASFRGYTHVLDLGLNGDWRVKYTGALSGVSLDITALDGFYTGSQGTNQAVGGRLDLLFVGAAPDALAGAFEFELISNPSVYVQGQFVTERDFRLVSSETLTMNSFTLVSMPKNSVLARSTDLTSAAASVIGTVADWAKPGGMGFLEAKYTDIIRKGTATNLVATSTNSTFVAHPVSWGAWSAGWVVQTDPANSATQTTMAEPLYWMQLMPTDPAVIAAKTGSLTYATPVAILGGGAGGAINSGSFSFGATVDFNTGSLTAGSMGFNGLNGLDTVNWLAQFGGSIQGSSIIITPTLISYGVNTLAPTGASNATGNINAVFTGPNAEMIGGNFNFATPTGAPTPQSIQGVFLVQ